MDANSRLKEGHLCVGAFLWPPSPLWSIAAHANSTKVVIGDIDDMSGPYADTNGPGAVEAIKMAIADFGGSASGKG